MIDKQQLDIETIELRDVVEDKPVLLYQCAGHAIYWLGISEETAFRCNTYLILDGQQGIVVDPGGRQYFKQVRERIEQVMPVEHLAGMILCHQDPDVAGSMVEWLDVNPAMKVYSTPRTHVLLPHYGRNDYEVYDVEAQPELTLSSGNTLRFIQAPFLHFPGAFVTYDTASGYLFSGDIWAALDTDWSLVVDDFSAHQAKMDLFHKDYMASNLAAQGFVQSLAGFDIRAILPQHGSLIRKQHVNQAMDYLRQLRCGLDLIYASELARQEERVLFSTEMDNIFEPAMPDEQPGIGELAGEGVASRQLHEALKQAARLATLRERALHDLTVAERRLQARGELLDEAQRIAHVGNWVWHVGSDAIIWSDEIFRIFAIQRSQQAIRYEDFVAHVHPDDRERLKLAVEQALQNNDKYDIQHRIIRPDGEVRIVHERAVVTTDDDGEAVEMHGTVQDITERVRMESIVAHAEKMHSVGGLAVGMAHELNSPLGGVLEGLQNIQRRLSSELAKNREVAEELGLDLDSLDEYMRRREVKRFMESIADAGRRAADIVSNLLRFSSKTEERAEAVELPTLIDQTIRLASMDYELKKKYDFSAISIEREYDPDLPSVYCVAAEIQQVLLNLLRNAVKAVFEHSQDNESPCIKLCTRLQQNMAIIEVTDNGPGLDEQVQRRLFEPFFTTRETGEGTGLGLSVAYFIVHEEHGGSIDVESEPGKGTRFIVRLPVDKTGQKHD